MIEFLTASLALTGALFMLLAALGLHRLPDVFSRMHAATNGGTAGVAGIYLAVAAHFADLAHGAEALFVIVLVFLTAPVGAHMIARAAYRVGVPLWEGTVCDDLREALDIENDGDRVADSNESAAPPSASKNSPTP